MPARDSQCVARDDAVTLPGGGPRLALRRADGPRRPFLLVHGLSSNARMWDGVTERLAAAGHDVVAVDLRGHGRSEVTEAGYDTATAAADVAALIAALGWTGQRAPIVAGQSWGGHVALELAARHRGLAAVALLDGGWVRLPGRFADVDEAWSALAPPVFDGAPWANVVVEVARWTAGWPPEGVTGALANFTAQPDGTARARLTFGSHRAIVASLWEHDPRALYPHVDVPALLIVAAGDGPDSAIKSSELGDAEAGLADVEVRWYHGAHHDLHAQQPDRTSADLLDLAARAERR